ncbi:MAG: type II toxin-antitoxin system HicA family toxin [Gammaproteobacteria bacterium]|nr:type II toxin-antitoxin system HicA family toxin [Gammaproteobacteria bacterium]MCP4334954.1 type II toxin-antitoxin system HicA family toxin [Gammaproteobacteria bacterium]
MGKREKLIANLKSVPADFTWQDLKALLKAIGYLEIQGSGSRVKFDDGNADQMINLHKPHPGNIVKRYALRQLIEKLEQGGLI